MILLVIILSLLTINDHSGDCALAAEDEGSFWFLYPLHFRSVCIVLVFLLGILCVCVANKAVRTSMVSSCTIFLVRRARVKIFSFHRPRNQSVWMRVWHCHASCSKRRMHVCFSAWRSRSVSWTSSFPLKEAQLRLPPLTFSSTSYIPFGPSLLLPRSCVRCCRRERADDILLCPRRFFRLSSRTSLPRQAQLLLEIEEALLVLIACVSVWLCLVRSLSVSLLMCKLFDFCTDPSCADALVMQRSVIC